MSAATKAEQACMAYAHNSAMVHQLGQAIGRQLGQCKGVQGTLHRWSHEHPDEHSDDQTHLAAYYMVSSEPYPTEARERMFAAMQACQFCRVANQLVQDRKTFRQRLGAAKRAIVAADKAVRAEHGLQAAEAEVAALIKQREAL